MIQNYIGLPSLRITCVNTGTLTDLSFKVVSCNFLSVFHCIRRFKEGADIKLFKETFIAHTLAQFYSPKRIPARRALVHNKYCKESIILFVTKRQRTDTFCFQKHILRSSHFSFTIFFSRPDKTYYYSQNVYIADSQYYKGDIADNLETFPTKM